jgi:hypothetical protein
MIYALLLGNIFFFSRKNNKAEEDEEETKKNDLLCRFVVDGTGKRLGESVSLDGDIMIIKSKKTYLGVPLKHIEEKDKALLVKGLVDFGRAVEMGEKWRKDSFRELNQTDEVEGNENE